MEQPTTVHTAENTVTLSSLQLKLFVFCKYRQLSLRTDFV